MAEGQEDPKKEGDFVKKGGDAVSLGIFPAVASQI